MHEWTSMAEKFLLGKAITLGFQKVWGSLSLWALGIKVMSWGLHFSGHPSHFSSQFKKGPKNCSCRGPEVVSVRPWSRVTELPSTCYATVHRLIITEQQSGWLGPQGLLPTECQLKAKGTTVVTWPAKVNMSGKAKANARPPG